MNENVTNKTPKRRRWVARLLVSALCILLASSLLFVGVVAENIDLVAQFTGNYGLATTAYNNYVYPFGSNFLVYSNSYMVYLQAGSSVKSVFDIRSSDGYDSTYLSDNLSFYYDGVALYGLTTRKTSTDLLVSFYTFTIVDNEIISASAVNVSTYVSGTHYSPFTTFVVVDGNVYSFYFYGSSSTSTLRYLVFLKLSGTDLTYYYYASLGVGLNSYYNSASFQNGNLILGLYKNSRCYLFNIFSNSFSYVEPPSSSTTGQNYVFDYEGDTYYINSNVLCKWNIDTVSFERVGSGVSGYYFSSNNGVLYSYSLPSSMSISYTVYSGLPTNEPPSDSSDETTESPPLESSDESSEEPAGGGTKIWRVDRGFVESYAGTIDLTNATEIRAFLGVFTSSGSGFSLDRAVPLTLEVYRDGSDTPDSYTFDFYAYGWGVLGLDGFPNSYDSYIFPDVIGLYYEIPIPSDGEGLLFPTFAPYGSIYVNFSDSVYPDNIQRVTFNLHNSQGYLDVNFVSSSSTSFTIYNDDLTKGKTYSFDSGTFNYKCFFDLNGEYSETEWFSPQFGSSIKYYAEDVLESGLYAIYSFNDDSIEYPWGNGEWSDIILGNNSRLEEISVDYEVLESKANALYGNYTFDPLFGADFNDAVSRFNVVKDSSGGQTVLGFFNGMWSVHPFASSMIAIVGTLAIVGFIIRKL